jgi:hypothetical protein
LSTFTRSQSTHPKANNPILNYLVSSKRVVEMTPTKGADLGVQVQHCIDVLRQKTHQTHKKRAVRKKTPHESVSSDLASEE